MSDARIKPAATVRAYKEVFLDETGQLAPAARLVMDDLYRRARFFSSAPGVEPQVLAALEGGRDMVRHILRRTKTTAAELSRHLTIEEEQYE